MMISLNFLCGVLKEKVCATDLQHGRYILWRHSLGAIERTLTTRKPVRTIRSKISKVLLGSLPRGRRRSRSAFPYYLSAKLTNLYEYSTCYPRLWPKHLQSTDSRQSIYSHLFLRKTHSQSTKPTQRKPRWTPHSTKVLDRRESVGQELIKTSNAGKSGWNK